MKMNYNINRFLKWMFIKKTEKIIFKTLYVKN